MFSKTITNYKHFKKGFSIIEVSIALAIMTAILFISVIGFVFLRKVIPLYSTSDQIINVLRIAQTRTLLSEGSSQYGVYFDTSSSPHQYTLFRGPSYDERDASFDQITSLPSSIELYNISFEGENSTEVVFNRLTGATDNYGEISVRLHDESRSRTIYVESGGSISYTPPSVSEDTRQKDSRHVTFKYSRTIDSSEIITLRFDQGGSNVVINLPISQNQIGSNFSWEGTTTVGGSDQTIKIHTLRFNNPDTLFSIFRDLRYNDKELLIEISGDNTGFLTNYSEDGLTTTYESIYVESFTWQ